MSPRLPQMELLAELKKRQSAPLVREGKDGAIEDIITGRRRWRAAPTPCAYPFTLGAWGKRVL